MDGRIRETDWTDRQDQLVELLPLVTFLAKKLVKKLPRQVEIDDLVQDGIFGAAGALRTFDPARGVKLRTYAALRIRGAMLDGLRSRREGARNHHACGLVPAIRSIESMTEKAGAMLLQDQSSTESLADLEQRDQVRAMLRELDRRSRLVVTMHELDGLTMKEIGRALGLCESRVSQIHTLAMRQLRAQVRDDDMTTKGTKDVDIDEEAYNAADKAGKASCNDRIAELPAPTPEEEAAAHSARIEWMRARTAGEIPMDTPAPPTAVERAIARINATKEAQMPKKLMYEVQGKTMTADAAATLIGCEAGSICTMTRGGSATIKGVLVKRAGATDAEPDQSKKSRRARVQTVGPVDQDDQRTPVRVVEDNIQELLDELQRERDRAIEAIHERFNAQKDALERLRTNVA